MASLTFRRPTVLPIHPSTWVRPAGNIDFRVTQRFDVQDSFYGGAQKHNAVDLGNFRCGDAVVAMVAGTAYRVKDNATALGAPTDALGLRIDHGFGITTEYWHLNGYSVADGANVVVGQQVGIVGKTGLGNVCHLHTEVKVNGVRIDPEPLMFGEALMIQEDDVIIRAVVTEKWNVRVGGTFTRPDGTQGSFATAEVVTSVAELTLTNGTDARLLDYGARHEALIMPRSALTAIAGTRIVGIPSAGFTQAQLDAAKAAGFTDAKGRAIVAVQGI